MLYLQDVDVQQVISLTFFESFSPQAFFAFIQKWNLAALVAMDAQKGTDAPP